MNERFLCVHGHFYQPPRENPWTEAIEAQLSARPDHDWNARIARECYIPNGVARVIDEKRTVVDLVNNYSWMSFNFGPTLLSWFQTHCPAAYARLLEADRESAKRLDGHGNAVAQAYNHMIMPLADPRDRRTQILWGLEDFRRRFGREPEAMWLPETAVSDEVLADLAAHGLKYAILAPNQAEKVRPLAGGEWSDVSGGGIDTSRPYRWKGAAGGSIDLFFYHGGVSHSVAFERLMGDSAVAARRLMEAYPAQGGGLVSAATDGESYGHHQAFGEMGLAHLLRYELPAQRVRVVNYAWFLAKHPPVQEVRIKPGPDGLGTAWSCAHGVRRWSDDCGCGRKAAACLAPAPARRLGLAAGPIGGGLRERGGPPVKPWAARDAYIRVVLDRSPESVERFLAEQAAGSPTGAEVRRVLELLEMQRYGMLMFTSCGWFFSEISGLEGTQNLKYAARAVELARRASGRDLEPEFLKMLAAAPSNIPDFGTGAGVYEKLVRPAVFDEEKAAALYAILQLQGEPARKIYRWTAQSERGVRNSVAGVRLAAGRARFRDSATGESFSRVYLALALPDESVKAFVGDGSAPEEALEALIRRVETFSAGDLLEGADALRASLFGERAYSLKDLFHDDRERLLNLILARRLQQLEASCEDVIEDYLPLAERYAALLEVPPSEGPDQLAVGHWLARRASEPQSADAAPVEEMRA